MAKTVAVVGASSDRAKFGNKALRAFQAQGYRVVPINPSEAEVEGLATYPSVVDVPGDIDIATVYVQPHIALGLLDGFEKKGIPEIKAYAQKYGLHTEQEAEHLIRFISNPLDRSYIFTYFAGRELLEELFARGDRYGYFARLLTEPVTPGQVQGWIGK